MDEWTFPPPESEDIGDHAVPLDGAHLRGRRVALLVTGGIAAMKAPLLARALRRQGADVVAFTSTEAERYVSIEALEWSTLHPVVNRLTPAAEHLSDAAPFDAYLIAPATYNTINKIASGVADGVITSAAASAIGRMERGKAVVLVAPTMHGSLHNSILVGSLRRLHGLGVRVVPPRDAYGKHNLPDEAVLTAEVARALSRSQLRGQRILVAGGAPFVPMPGGCEISARVPGGIGAAMAPAIVKELALRGAETTYITAEELDPEIPCVRRRTARHLDAFTSAVSDELANGCAALVVTAAFPRVRPVVDGGREAEVTLYPARGMESVMIAYPGLPMVTFSYEEASDDATRIAAARALLGPATWVVACGSWVSATAWMVDGLGEAVRIQGAGAVAAAVANRLELALAAPVNES